MSSNGLAECRDLTQTLAQYYQRFGIREILIQSNKSDPLDSYVLLKVEPLQAQQLLRTLVEMGQREAQIGAPEGGGKSDPGESKDSRVLFTP